MMKYYLVDICMSSNHDGKLLYKNILNAMYKYLHTNININVDAKSRTYPSWIGVELLHLRPY